MTTTERRLIGMLRNICLDAGKTEPGEDCRINSNLIELARVLLDSVAPNHEEEKD